MPNFREGRELDVESNAVVSDLVNCAYVMNPLFKKKKKDGIQRTSRLTNM